jgi:hypothetical protein
MPGRESAASSLPGHPDISRIRHPASGIRASGHPGIRIFRTEAPLPEDVAARYAEIARIFDQVFMKSFFIAKTSCSYTMNFLHQE